MAYYKITSFAGGGKGKLLNVAAASAISSNTNVTIWEPSCYIDQIWSITALGANQQVKTINNQDYMLNANTSTWNCNVATSNVDTYVNFELVSADVYYIRLVSDTSKYLTAEGFANGANVKWAALAETELERLNQQWKVEATTIPAVYARVKGGSGGLSESQKTVNARYIYNFLIAQGFTKNAACGVLGNMDSESGMNPAVWHELNNINSAYGLVQWYPSAYSFLTYAVEKGIITSPETAEKINYVAMDDPELLMDTELECLMWCCAEAGHWLGTTSFSDFKASTMTADELAEIFRTHYERNNGGPGDRGSNALKWYNIL